MPTECGICEMRSRVEALEEDSRRNQQTHKEFFGRFEAQQVKIALTEDRYTQIKADTTAIKSQLQALSEKPAKRWDSVVGALIATIVTIIVGFALAKIGIV